MISKSKIDLSIFDLYTTILSWIIRFKDASEYKEFAEKAESISPDPDDTQYFALALKLDCAIWSNDLRLKKQSQIKIYNTDELRKLLE